MKMGLENPVFRKSLRARTTSKLKRQVKRAIIQLTRPKRDRPY